jgi:hypothetical protein
MGWEIGFRALSNLAGTEIQPGSTPETLVGICYSAVTSWLRLREFRLPGRRLSLKFHFPPRKC